MKWLGISRVYWLLALFAVTFTIAMQLAPEQRSFVNPKISTKPYVWPVGCENREYKKYDKINRNCLVASYYIGDGQIWGWPRNATRPYYYRINNDAVLITNVIFGEIAAREVTIYEVVEDVFIVERGK